MNRKSSTCFRSGLSLQNVEQNFTVYTYAHTYIICNIYVNKIMFHIYVCVYICVKAFGRKKKKQKQQTVFILRALSKFTWDKRDRVVVRLEWDSRDCCLLPST